jgi:hypothetical protein
VDRTRSRYFLSMMLIIVVASVTLTAHSPVKAVPNSGSYYREFAWDYGGLQWTWNLTIPKLLYNEYQSVPVSERVQNGPAGYGFLCTTHDSYVISLADALNESATGKGYGSYEKVSFILAFVQSLPYTSDFVTTGYDEYPRFPLETLVDGGGDCEDTSILFATLTLILNYDTIFISPPSHYAIGIWGNNLAGSYYTLHNRTYYYCETTGNNWKIGQLPDEYKGVSAYLYTINEYAQYSPGQGVSGEDFYPILERLLILLIIVGIGVIGVGYILIRRAKKREAQEVSPQPPSLSSI